MFFSEKENKIILSVYVIPNSSETQIKGLYNNFLKIKLRAKPKENEANKELISFLSKKLKIPKSNIEIIKGHAQKQKLVCVYNCSVDIIKNLY